MLCPTISELSTKSSALAYSVDQGYRYSLGVGVGQVNTAHPYSGISRGMGQVRNQASCRAEQAGSSPYTGQQVPA